MAHRIPALALAFSTLSALTGCGSDDGTPAASLSWQFQCETALNCTAQRFREITSFDGERGNRISCSGVDDDFGNVVLRFSAENNAGRYGIASRGVTVNRESLAITAAGGCQTTVTENNEFVGRCGNLAPSADQPCQLRFDQVGGGTITGFLRCHGIPLRTSNASRGRVLADGVTFDPNAQVNTQGLSFAFSSCSGI